MSRRLRHRQIRPLTVVERTYTEEVLHDNPLAYWLVDELDNSPGSRAINFWGGRELDRGGTATFGSIAVMPSGQYAILMNGTSSQNLSRVDEAWMSPHAGASGEMTLECWFNMDNLSTIRTLFWKGATSNFEFSLAVTTTGELTFTVFTAAGGTAGSATSASSTIAAATDYHVAATYDRAGNSVKVYANGAEVGSGTTSADSSDGTATLYFGKRGSVDDRFMLGRSSHLAVYPTALEPGRIARHYAAAYV